MLVNKPRWHFVTSSVDTLEDGYKLEIVTEYNSGSYLLLQRGTSCHCFAFCHPSDYPSHPCSNGVVAEHC